jgi:multidrug efflux pump subunit AcrA (membrane-fusion protein)
LALDAATAAAEKAKRDLAELLAWRRPEDIVRLRASRDEAAARFTTAKSELNRVTSLYARKVISESQYDLHKAEFATAKAVFDRAEAELAIATNGPTEAAVAVAKAKVAQADAEVSICRDKLDKTTIRAPYDAVITDRYVDEGERVTALPRVEIMEIMDLSLVIVQVGIPERHMHKVNIRDRVTVRVEGVTDPVPGIVVLVNGKIDPDSRTYRARVAVDNRDGRFKAGQFVRVGFTFASSSGSLAVPSRSVTYTGGQSQVFVYADERVSLRTVKLGLSDGRRTEILAGLDKGETVVVDDPAILSDGMAVRLKPVGATAAKMSGGKR